MMIEDKVKLIREKNLNLVALNRRHMLNRAQNDVLTGGSYAMIGTKINYSVGEEVTIACRKGETCAVYPLDQDKIYYSEFSSVFMTSFSQQKLRNLIHESQNYIFEILIDFKGRLVVVEGFGHVKIITSKKEVTKLEEICSTSSSVC